MAFTEFARQLIKRGDCDLHVNEYTALALAPPTLGERRHRGLELARVTSICLWLLGILLEHVLKNIPFHDRCKEFTDQLTNAHVTELCLER
jgi:hypothetical protein